jgi:hypothetical protein
MNEEKKRMELFEKEVKKHEQVCKRRTKKMEFYFLLLFGSTFLNYRFAV